MKAYLGVLDERLACYVLPNEHVNFNKREYMYYSEDEDDDSEEYFEDDSSHEIDRQFKTLQEAETLVQNHNSDEPPPAFFLEKGDVVIKSVFSDLEEEESICYVVARKKGD